MKTKSLHKAAIVLKSLPKVQAAKILSRLEPADLKTVFDALDSVDRISSGEICDALMDLESNYGRRSTDEMSSVDSRQTLEPESSITHPARRAGEANYKPFAFVAEVEQAMRVKLLENEHPRHIADVISQLDSKVASEIVSGLEPALRVSVLRRVCSTEVPATEDLAQLSYALKLRLKKLLNQQKQPASQLDFAAELLSVSDENTRQQIIDHVEQQDPELATELKGSITQFSDLVSATDDEIRRLLASTDTALWAPALKNASLETRRKILDNMAERAASLLSAEISNFGPIDDLVAERAQQLVIQQFVEIRRTRNAESDALNSNVFPSVTTGPSITEPIYINTR